ncbi:hypothetical protein ACFX13_021303 [Malus domestica]
MISSSKRSELTVWMLGTFVVPKIPLHFASHGSGGSFREVIDGDFNVAVMKAVVLCTWISRRFWGFPYGGGTEGGRALLLQLPVKFPPSPDFFRRLLAPWSRDMSRALVGNFGRAFII